MAQYFRHGKSTPKYKIMHKFKMCVWVGDHINNLVELQDGIRDLMDEFTDYGRIPMTENEKEEWRDHLAAIMEKSKITLIQDSLKEYDKDLATEVGAKDGEKANFEFLIDAINLSIKKMSLCERKGNEEKAAASLAGAFMGVPSKGTGRGKGKDSDKAPKAGGKASPAGDTPTDPREPKAEEKARKGKQPSQSQAIMEFTKQVRDKIKLTSGHRLTLTKGKRARLKRARKEATKVERTVLKGPGGKTPPRAKAKTTTPMSNGLKKVNSGHRGAKSKKVLKVRAKAKV